MDCPPSLLDIAAIVEGPPYAFIACRMGLDNKHGGGYEAWLGARPDCDGSYSLVAARATGLLLGCNL